MMEDEIKSTAAGEENQAGAHAPSTPSEAVAAPAPTPAADVNASVPAPAPAATSTPAAPVATAPAAPVVTAPFSAPATANPAAAQQGAPASFCCNCGQALAAGGRLLPEVGDPAWHRRRDATTRGSVGERGCRSAGKSQKEEDPGDHRRHPDARGYRRRDGRRQR